MNAHRLKALCKQLGRDFGHAQCAEWAGVAPSVWSDYCNYDKPDTTIPGHRMFLWQDKAERQDFSLLFAACVQADEPVCRDPRVTASDALTTLAEAIQGLSVSLSDGVWSETERRAALGIIAELTNKVHALGVEVSAMPTGKLRAVS